MIKAINIDKSFGELQVLRSLSLDVATGEVVAIIGASGAGKSTLLQILGTLMSCDSGSVEIEGVDVVKLDDRALSRFRNQRIGFVFQFHNLLGEFTALENVAMPGYIAGREKKEVDSRAAELLTLMGLEQRLEHKPSAMSGGEQQRVAIARALINNPAVIFADEPSGNLDSKSRDEIHKLLFELRDKMGLTVVVVTHDDGLAMMADRKIVISDGEIAQ